jgi:hypothetical protein
MSDKNTPLKMFSDDTEFYICFSLGFKLVRDTMCGTCKHLQWEPSEETNYKRSCKKGIKPDIDWNTERCNSDYEKVNVIEKIYVGDECEYDYDLVVE